MTLNLEKRLLTVKEYHKMGSVGILKPTDRVELIEGEIIKMSPLNSNHTSHVKRITAFLYTLLKGKFIISVKDPVTLDKYSEPEPDLALLKLSKDFYAKGNPGPKDVILMMEVSDTTLEIDRKVKLPLYAKAGIKEYWIINLVDKQIEIYRTPEGNKYKQITIVHSGYTVRLPGTRIKIQVSEIVKT